MLNAETRDVVVIFMVERDRWVCNPPPVIILRVYRLYIIAYSWPVPESAFLAWDPPCCPINRTGGILRQTTKLLIRR